MKQFRKRGAYAKYLKELDTYLDTAPPVIRRRIAELWETIEAERTFRKAYEDQLTEIGKILVRAGILTTKEIKRQGVRFAVRDRFEPTKKRRK